MAEPLHTLDPTGRFSSRAGVYTRYRPAYPPEAVDLVLAGAGAGAGAPSGLVVADIGAGTGIFSRLIADRGAQVIAVEPNGAMRGAAAAHERVRWVEATGESTGLAASSVDLVTCAQAFHWLRPEEATREFCRILRPGGRIALLWNVGDESDPVARGYYDAVRRASNGFTTSHGHISDAPLERSPLWAQERHVLSNAQQLDAEGLIGRAMSASYAPRSADDATGRRLAEELEEVHRRHAGPDGLVTLRYQTFVYLARAPGRAP